jgi:hypothetical protein
MCLSEEIYSLAKLGALCWAGLIFCLPQLSLLPDIQAIIIIVIILLPITVAARSKALTDFTRSNTGVVGPNPNRGMDFCVRLLCVCVVLCVGSGPATG